MEYSNPIPMSRGLVLPSPTSPTLATANGNCLDVYDLHTLTLLHTTTAADPITHLSWGHSPVYGELLAASSAPSNSVLVLRTDTSAVILDVHDSPIRIAGLHLTRRGHLLLLSEHGLSLTLIDVHTARRLAVLPFIKPPSRTCPVLAVSPDARAVALLTRKDAVDGLCLLSLDTGAPLLVRRGPAQLAQIRSIAGLAWTPLGILLWGAPEDPLAHAAVALLAAPSGNVLMAGDPSSAAALRMGVSSTDHPDNPLHEHHLTPPSTAIGIAAVACAPSGAVFAIGGHDGRLRIVNAASWLQLACFKHESPRVDTDAPPVIFRERVKKAQGNGRAQVCENSSDAANAREGGEEKAIEEGNSGDGNYFEVVKCTGAVEISKRIRSTSDSGTGVSRVAFSACGGLHASRCDKAGNVVLVWDVRLLRLLAVLIFQEDARCLQWSGAMEPREGDARDCAQLAVVTGGEYVYLWRRGGAAAVRVRPAQRWRAAFQARKVVWAKGNEALIVSDGVSAKAFLAVYPV